MSLLWEARFHVMGVRTHENDHKEGQFAQRVNAMSNYEFLEMLDAIFDVAAKDAAR